VRASASRENNEIHYLIVNAVGEFAMRLFVQVLGTLPVIVCSCMFSKTHIEHFITN